METVAVPAKLALQSVLAVDELGLLLLVGQLSHAALPVAALYLPATQAVAASPSRPLYPAGATQEAIAVEPDALPVFEFVGQFVHCAFPVSALNVSTSQAEQLPSGPVYPAGHKAFKKQVDEVVAPARLKGVEEGHAVQTSGPAAALNLPASQLLHEPFETAVVPAEHTA